MSDSVLVIGGGIHGVGVAQAAAAAGYSVALLEQHHLASGTSSRSSKLIHGGLRYLESAQFSLVRESLRERELLLRLHNILRRQQSRQGSTDAIRLGELTFHVGRGELRRKDETVKLTQRERDLLRQFAQQPGTPISRHELASSGAEGGERAVDVQINRLRRKIEADPSNPVYLQTVRGKGYILHAE